jgi:flavin reductase (DIM6/NTAB) family NADH-FMN oxidoreductase RutF
MGRDDNGSAMPELATAFRNVMAAVCTPVSIVTTIVGEKPHGTTVSAFTSLSMDPPMVLVSLDKNSTLLRLVRQTRNFGVNVLGVGQEALALQFATKDPEKFASVGWAHDGDSPRLHGGGAWLSCRAAKFVDGGDHVVIFGEVVAVDPPTSKPLTYHARGFGTHVPARQ